MSNESRKDYFDKLRADCDLAEGAIEDEFCISFEIDDFSNIGDISQYDDIKDVLGIKNIIGGTHLSKFDHITNAIYVIEEVGGDIGKTRTAFSNYRDEQEKLKNDSKEFRTCTTVNEQENRVMYVGSVTKIKLGQRMREHLGDSGKGKASALHLNHWFKDINGKCKISVKVYGDNVSHRVLEIMEDVLASELRPAFGKHDYQKLP